MLGRIGDAIARLFRTLDMPTIPIPRVDDSEIEARVAKVRQETQNVLRAAELVHRVAAPGQWSTDLLANRQGRGEWHPGHH
jgi:lactate dehydrogenase-like 2-hydroxyacid dehydrogenase